MNKPTYKPPRKNNLYKINKTLGTLGFVKYACTIFNLTIWLLIWCLSKKKKKNGKRTINK